MLKTFKRLTFVEVGLWLSGVVLIALMVATALSAADLDTSENLANS